MKWKTAEKKLGQKRVIKRFAWRPEQIGTVVVWWETVYVRQSVGKDLLGRLEWYDREYVTEQEYLIYLAALEDA